MNYLIVILVLGLLIVFHELGHFWAARAMGMKVLKFSIGFMTPLAKWTSKKTGIVYQIGMLPLGGYVQIKGMNPFEEGAFEDADSYQTKSTWRRAIVIVAGPLANFFIAWAIIFALLTLGMPQKVPEPVMGTVINGKPAAAAGFKQGDHVLAISGIRTPSTEALVKRIGEFPNKKASLEIIRGGERVDLYAKDIKDISKFGLNPKAEQAAKIGFVMAQSPAQQGGIIANDVIEAVDDEPVSNWDMLLEKIGARPDKKTSVKIRRAGNNLTLSITPYSFNGQGKIGVYPSVEFDLAVIGTVTPESAADKAGFKAGDLIGSIHGVPISGWKDLSEKLSETMDMELAFGVLRGGERMTIEVVPEDVNGLGRIGISLAGVSVSLPAMPFYKSAWVSLERSAAVLVQNFKGLAMLFSGEGSAVGPVGIVKMAKTALDHSFGDFLYLVFYISLMLFMFNLFPLPALDGGHTVFLLYEIITRRRVNQKVSAVVNTIGLVLLLGMMLLVTIKELFWG